MLVDQLQDLGKEGLRLVLILGEVSVRRSALWPDHSANSPEMTITGIVGKRLRTTDRNSNPLMLGILGSASHLQP